MPVASVWPDATLEVLRARGVDWLVLQRHPLVPPHPLEKEVEGLEPQARFGGGRAVGKAEFDRQDAYYAPVAGWAGLERPGPELRVYRLTGD